jgi:hypothetical protein
VFKGRKTDMKPINAKKHDFRDPIKSNSRQKTFFAKINMNGIPEKAKVYFTLSASPRKSPNLKLLASVNFE